MPDNTARLKPADFRRNGYALVRKCWGTLLIAAVLMSVLGWIGDALLAHGEKVAQQVYDAQMAAFYAENPPPEDETERITWAYFDEWLADYDARQAYDSALLPWKVANLGVQAVDSLLSAVILVGLNMGLLAALRGGECSPSCVLYGFPRWKTAMWLCIRVGCCLLGWALLALVPAIMLGNMLGAVGELLGLVILLWVGFWAVCRYTLVFLHMADDPGDFTTSDYLREGVEDMRFFTVRGMLRTLWPVYLISVADVALTIAADYLPWLTIPASVFAVAAGLLTAMMQCACYTCIYDELRTHPPVKKALPDDEDDDE